MMANAQDIDDDISLPIPIISDVDMEEGKFIITDWLIYNTQ